jgi:hypothetical protein
VEARDVRHAYAARLGPDPSMRGDVNARDPPSLYKIHISAAKFQAHRPG